MESTLSLSGNSDSRISFALSLLWADGSLSIYLADEITMNLSKTSQGCFDSLRIALGGLLAATSDFRESKDLVSPILARFHIVNNIYSQEEAVSLFLTF